MEFENLSQQEYDKALELIMDNKITLDAARQIVLGRHKSEIDYVYNAIAIKYNKL
jgi:hypothetical protein